MKGISPMIAIVLLIALTVVVGGVIALFSTGLISTQTTTTGSEAEKATLCSPTVLSVDEVMYGTGLTDTVNDTFADTTKVAAQTQVVVDTALRQVNLSKSDGNYYTSGSLLSTNLLSGQTAGSISTFGYTASSIPSWTNLTVQFSQDNSSWYNSTGTLNGYNNLTAGSNTIDLSALSWIGANFYYNMTFSSNGTNTPILADINVSYAVPNANVTVKYVYGTQSITGFNVFFVDTARSFYNKTQTGTLNPGDSTTWSINASGLTGSLKSLRVIAMCQDTYPVGGECKSGQACMK